MIESLKDHDPGFALDAHFARRKALLAALDRGDERAAIGAALAGIESKEDSAARRKHIREVLPALLAKVPALRAVMPRAQREAEAAPEDYDTAYSDRVIAVLTEAVTARADDIARDGDALVSDAFRDDEDAS